MFHEPPETIFISSSSIAFSAPSEISLFGGINVKIFGSISFTNEKTKTVSFDMTFDEQPTVLATPTQNVHLYFDVVSTTSFTISSTVNWTGAVYWIAINKTNTGREMGVLVDSGTVTFSGNKSATVTFATPDWELAASRFSLTPTILVSTNGNVNTYIDTPTNTGFTLHTSANFTGIAYWTAFLVRKL